MNIETLLEEKIKSEIEGWEDAKKDPELYKTKVDGVTKLADRVIEMEKLKYERQDKKAQMKEDKLHRWIKHGIEGLGILAPLAVTIWGASKSIKFEKEGTFTTIMGRGFINKLLPRK